MQIYLHLGTFFIIFTSDFYGEVSFYCDYFSSSTAACAAARRAIGTRNGEQLA